MGGDPSILGLYNKMVAHTSMMQDADIRNMDMIHVITTYDDMQKTHIHRFVHKLRKYLNRIRKKFNYKASSYRHVFARN